MKILNREISDKKPPFIIAEISTNHNQSIKRTFKLKKKKINQKLK
jgi:sialic acid synthase SpsE|tara:strand:+ start:1318 stop:1452 length:135 start_codon:yes stop_codon:yes gene_type:complete